jgi:uncharacterized protein YuzE
MKSLKDIWEEYKNDPEFIAEGETLDLGEKLINQTSFGYDADTDVMYISFGEPRPCRTKELEDGIVLRYTPDGKLSGITIIGFKERIKSRLSIGKG